MVDFAAADGSQVISFKRADFKLVPDVDVNDFSVTQFQGWPNPKGTAKAPRTKPKLPVKNYSEPVWGDLDKCILATVVTQEMISQRPQ
jgi:hypothetical protein